MLSIRFLSTQNVLEFIPLAIEESDKIMVDQGTKLCDFFRAGISFLIYSMRNDQV